MSATHETSPETILGATDPGLIGQLAALATVATTGNYSRAAHVLGLGHPSAVQRRIATLATSVGRAELVRYDKSTHRVSITTAGSEVLELFRMFETEWQQSIATRLGDEVVRVGAFPAHVTNVLAEAAMWTSEMMPSVRFTWSVTDGRRQDHGKSIAEDLELGKLDVAVCAGRPPGLPNKRCKRLYSWQLVAVGRDLPTEVELDFLSARRLGTSPPTHLSRDLLERALATRSETFRRRISIDAVSESTQALLALALEGVLTAVVPSDVVPNNAQSAPIRFPKRIPSGADYWISWSADAGPGALRFVERSCEIGQQVDSRTFS